MDLDVKICTRKISNNKKSLYLCIKLNGHKYFENLGFSIRESERGSENYYSKLKRAEDIRLLRLCELSNNPNDIYEKKLTETPPPEYIYIGSIVRNGGSYRFLPQEIKEYIEGSLLQRVLSFSDFIQFVNNLERKFDFHSSGIYENYSTVIRISPPYYCGNYKPFVSFSLMRNDTSKALECFGFPCKEIIKLEGRDIELDETINVVVRPKKSQKTRTYLMKDDLLGYVKIGRSVNVLAREHTLEAQNPKISLFAVCQRDVEKELHHRYKEFRIRGEWFKLRKRQIYEIIKEYDFDILENKSK